MLFRSALQPKHTKLKPEEVKKVLDKFNISLSQLPKINLIDSALPEGCMIGDVIMIDREEGGKIQQYYRVVIS